MTFHTPPAIVVSDSTLRDSQPTGQVALSRHDRIAIARALEDAGVDEIEFALPSSRTSAIDDLAQVVGAICHSRPTLWGPATKGTVNAAVRLGLNAICLAVLVSGRRASPQRMEGVIEYACERGLSVTISGEDASRADLDVVCDLMTAAEAAGARRFRYSDTMGVLHPVRTHQLFRQLCAETDLELEFRGHDDFGLATANTLAAIQGGTTHISVSMARTGERPGIASLPDIAHAISMSILHRTNLDLPRLAALATLVGATTGRPSAFSPPIPIGHMQRSIVPDVLALVGASIPAVATRVGE